MRDSVGVNCPYHEQKLSLAACSKAKADSPVSAPIAHGFLVQARSRTQSKPLPLNQSPSSEPKVIWNSWKSRRMKRAANPNQEKSHYKIRYCFSPFCLPRYSPLQNLLFVAFFSIILILQNHCEVNTFSFRFKEWPSLMFISLCNPIDFPFSKVLENSMTNILTLI